MIKYLIVLILSLIFFIFNLIKTGNVFVRPNSEGIKVFSLSGLWEYIKAPFNDKYKTVWGLIPGIGWRGRINMLKINWVFITSTALIGTYIISKIF